MIKNDKENNADNEEDDTWNRTDIAQAQAVFVQLRLNVVTNQASVKSSHTPRMQMWKRTVEKRQTKTNNTNNANKSGLGQLFPHSKGVHHRDQSTYYG